jgi:hypothetical protein
MQEMEQRRAVYEAEQSKAAVAEMGAAVDRTWNELFGDKTFVTALDSKVVEDARRFAKETNYFDAPPDERAYAVYSGLLLPHVVGQLGEANAKVADLEKALSKYKKATPKVSGNADTSVPDTGTGGFLEAIEKRFG